MPNPAPTASSLQRLRALSHLFDDSIRVPGTDFRFGLDAIIGLVPGIGDATGAAMSAYLLVEAGRLGAPKATLIRMAGNVALEAVVGTIPFLGDLFDAGWKANLRNLKLLEAHVVDPSGTARASQGVVTGLVIGVLVMLLASAALAAWVLWFLARNLF